MADFLKTLTKRNTTKPATQPDFVISGPQTFRPVLCYETPPSMITSLLTQGIHVSFDNEKGFQVSFLGEADFDPDYSLGLAERHRC